MKKTALFTALAFVFTGAIAQDSGGGLVSKKGETILPEADDWALVIDAVPVMSYFGNILNGNTNNGSPAFGYPGTPLAITGKMFKDEKTAYRGMIRLGFGSTTQRNFVRDDVAFAASPTSTSQVEDSKKDSYNNITLGGGLEFRRGKTRLQGYYGGMLMFGIGGSKTDYTYGNGFTTTNMAPTSTTNWSTGASAPAAAGRTTSVKMGSSLYLGLRGFIGAEYFILPKFSIGAEFGWGLGLSSTGDGESTVESWDGTANAPKSTSQTVGGSSSFGIDTDVNGTQLVPTGSLNLALHF